MSHPSSHTGYDRETGTGEVRTAQDDSPCRYLDFLGILSQAKLVLTDSGGIQEETTALGVPCLTLRENTERPVTVTQGTNEVVGVDPVKIRQAVEAVLCGKWKTGRLPPLWDGHSAERIVDIPAEEVPARVAG